MLIKLKVHADSKVSALKKISENSYEVWVRVQAKNGLANKAALATLAKALNENPHRLHLVKGTTTPNKIVKVFEPD